MNYTNLKPILTLSLLAAFATTAGTSFAQENKTSAGASTQATVILDTTGSDWVELGASDFVRANCDEATWTWDGATVHCTGKPVGVLRSKKKYRNL